MNPVGSVRLWAMPPRCSRQAQEPVSTVTGRVSASFCKATPRQSLLLPERCEGRVSGGTRQRRVSTERGDLRGPLPPHRLGGSSSSEQPCRRRPPGWRRRGARVPTPRCSPSTHCAFLDFPASSSSPRCSPTKIPCDSLKSFRSVWM